MRYDKTNSMMISHVKNVFHIANKNILRKFKANLREFNNSIFIFNSHNGYLSY